MSERRPTVGVSVALAILIAGCTDETKGQGCGNQGARLELQADVSSVPGLSGIRVCLDEACESQPLSKSRPVAQPIYFRETRNSESLVNGAKEALVKVELDAQTSISFPQTSMKIHRPKVPGADDTCAFVSLIVSSNAITEGPENW
jgi:hypothetical protein